ncbi:MucBP domain-containing protein [Schleiferilactobacillus shenzhenensis]|nr:MucBP domain-containing protein [Schleiferilactobacillus shenzhenensis]
MVGHSSVTTVSASTDASASKANLASYPDWLEKAIVGTPYSQAAFASLPAAQQSQLLRTLHPELSPTLAYNTPTIGSVQQSQIPSNQTAKPALAAALALTQGAALPDPAKSYLDIQPTVNTSAGTGTASAFLAAAGSAVTTNTTVNIGNFSADDVAALTSSSFRVVSAESPLTTADITVTLDKSQTPAELTLTVSKAGIDALTADQTTYNGRKVRLTATNASGNQLAIVFNLWLPLVDRAYASMPLGNGLTAQYMYNSFFDPKWIQGTSVTRGQIDDAQDADIPNINVVDTTKSSEPYKYTRVTGLYGDWGMSMPNPGSFDTNKAGSWTSSSLIVGLAGVTNLITDDSRPVSYHYYPQNTFDEIKHMHMYPDSMTNPSKIYLKYDGYFNTPTYLSVLGFPADTHQVVLHVKGTLGPSTDGSQMAYSEVVTNPVMINDGESNRMSIKGLYFVRTYDTAIQTFIGPTTDDPDQQKIIDNIPIRFSAIATSGPRAGKNEGVYIRSQVAQPNYIVRYNFNVPDGPDGWLGTHYLTNGVLGNGNNGTLHFWQTTTDNGLAGYDYFDEHGKLQYGSFATFNKPTGLGQANTVNAVNGLAYGDEEGTPGGASKMDSGIGMKWSPIPEFKPGDSKTMAFNTLVNDSQPPVLRVNDDIQYVPKNAATIKIPGTVSDINSKHVDVYLSLTKPNFAGNQPPVAPATDYKIGSVDYGSTTPPHTTPLSFDGDLSGVVPANVLAGLSDGDTHTVYLYAIDTPQSPPDVDAKYAQTEPKVSIVEPVTFNKKRNITIKFQSTTGQKLHDDVAKSGNVRQSYNFNSGSADLTTTDATDLIGQPPATLRPDANGPLYLLSTPLPSEGQGTVPDADTTITYTYATQYVEFVPHDLYFGQQPVPASSGTYQAVRQTAGDPDPRQFVVNDYRTGTNTGIDLSATLSAFKDQAATGVGPDITNARIVFTNSSGAKSVSAGSGTPVTIASGLARNPATQAQIPVDFSQIDLTVASPTTGNILPHPYAATLTYTINYGL